MLKNDIDKNVNYGGMNWAFQIKSIYDKIGMSDIWLNQNLILNNFNFIKECIIDIY